MVGGGVGVAFQGLLKLLKIVLCHCHLPLHQQNVLDTREGAGMRERARTTVRNRMLDIEQSERKKIKGSLHRGEKDKDKVYIRGREEVLRRII